eukprot:TRINITY_DN81415_c0_g1_i1.p1 TRINITY_DN81415_c0_g1~~TRINITY_DN81415_c0_g1_i1.p1  ORF type:complete len:444 (+),score=55.98 TRINITY_DN81415_c0_g1_i1:136-1467(+)
MGLLKPEEYVSAHGSQDTGLIPVRDLGTCLESVFADLGCTDDVRRRTLAASLVEEYSLRTSGCVENSTDPAPVGAGALSRLMVAASSAWSSRAPKRPAEEEAASCDKSAFDAAAKERALQAEANAWAAPSCAADLPIADVVDIPTVDLASLDTDPASVAAALKAACVDVGFHYITNHGVPETLLQRGVSAIEAFTALPSDIKSKYAMDKADSSYPGGAGYMPVHNRKLPKRAKGNVNEAFIIKRELGPRNITLEQMPWPAELGSTWRGEVEAYANAMEELSARMLPAYSLALGESTGFLAPAFKSPMYRLRLGFYPAVNEYEKDQYGIGPHVDTSFFTVLHRAEQQPCLVVWSSKRERWVRAPSKPGTLLINTGEILKQVSNDSFHAARHYVLNESPEDRKSLAFFFNATADFKLSVAAGAGGGPPKYPPTSYLDGQGVIQGE